jgi:hypothetical protein
VSPSGKVWLFFGLEPIILTLEIAFFGSALLFEIDAVVHCYDGWKLCSNNSRKKLYLYSEQVAPLDLSHVHTDHHISHVLHPPVPFA